MSNKKYQEALNEFTAWCNEKLAEDGIITGDEWCAKWDELVGTASLEDSIRLAEEYGVPEEEILYDEEDLRHFLED